MFVGISEQSAFALRTTDRQSGLPIDARAVEVAENQNRQIALAQLFHLRVEGRHAIQRNLSSTSSSRVNGHETKHGVITLNIHTDEFTGYSSIWLSASKSPSHQYQNASTSRRSVLMKSLMILRSSLPGPMKRTYFDEKRPEKEETRKRNAVVLELMNITMKRPNRLAAITSKPTSVQEDTRVQQTDEKPPSFQWEGI